MSKPKFDKKKCYECKWHGVGVGYPVRLPNGTTIQVHCNYSAFHDSSSLRAISKEDYIDFRGTDYNNCLLFCKGKMEKE